MWQCGQCSGPTSKLLRHNGQVMAGTLQGNRSGLPRHAHRLTRYQALCRSQWRIANEKRGSSLTCGVTGSAHRPASWAPKVCDQAMNSAARTAVDGIRSR
jgi:hypothetical protein